MPEAEKSPSQILLFGVRPPRRGSAAKRLLAYLPAAGPGRDALTLEGALADLGVTPRNLPYHHAEVYPGCQCGLGGAG